jgi:hypothetical protein
MSAKKSRTQASGTWSQKATLSALFLVSLSIYLFVSAPPPLPEAGEEDFAGEHRIDVDLLLELVAMENAAFRTLYTKEVVGPGIRLGLVYDENWLIRGSQTGPLPAVALRGVAVRLDRSPADLGLFLGAEYAINRGNKFTGHTLDLFREIVDDHQPRYFYDTEQGLHTAMFPDFAVATPCVSCHSNHEKTPKDDWKMGDVMGATTWTYPRGQVGMEELVLVLTEVRRAFKETYQSYLDRVVRFDLAPEVGERWPSEGLFLPDADVFMAEQERRASRHTVALMIKAVGVEAGVEQVDATD